MKKLKIVFWTLLVSIIMAIILINILGKKVNPIILRYSQAEAKRFGVFAINTSLDQKFINELDEDIFETTFNDKQEIQMINFKSKKVNLLLEKVAKKVQQNLVDLENGNTDQLVLANTFKGMKFKEIKTGVVCEMPFGALFSNAIVANNGPVFPIKLNFIGDVITNLNTKVSSYGINIVYLEVSIHIEIEERITMPKFTDSVKISNDIPLTIKIIQGTLPDYYLSALERNSPIFSLPIE